MKSVAQEISDLKSEFEGGASFSLDWYTVLRQTQDVLLTNLNAEELKRVVPIYGGLTSNIQVYYCPADIRVPSRLYSNQYGRTFEYQPSAAYWKHRDWYNKFTIEKINGVRFIVIRHPVSGANITLEAMTDVTGWTGGVSLTKNTFNFLPGSTASLQGTFSDTINDISKVLTAPVNVSSLLGPGQNGVVLVPMYLTSAIDFDHLQIRIETDTSNYYQFVSTQDSVGDYIRDGQNMVRFDTSGYSSFGTPDPTNIKAIKINAIFKAGKSGKVIFGKISIQKNYFFSLEYFSNQMFIDGTTGAWKSTPAKGDTINLDGSILQVFHFEACRIVVRKVKTDQVNAAESQRMDTELARAMANYNRDFPSSAIPMSYSILPDIPYAPDPFWGESFLDLPERVGFNFDADKGTPQILFADAENLASHLNGVNQTFTLAHQPQPAESLILIFNGEVLMAGSGYTLAGKVITLLAPYYQQTGVGFTASYRYYAGT